MKRTLLLGVGVAMATTLVLGGGWTTGAAATAPATDQTIRIDAVATQENFVDVAPSGPSLGDLLLVRDAWKNLSGDVVGYDGITCTVTSLEPNGDTRLECLM